MATKPLLIGVIAGFLIGILLGYAITIPKTSELDTRERAAIEERNALQSQLTQIHNTDPYITLVLRDTQIAQFNQQIVEKNTQIATLQSQITSLKTSSLDLIAASFSRTDDTSILIRNWIGKANNTIEVAIFSFTQDSIANALITAKGRGVKVRVFMEYETINDSGSEYARLLSVGVPIRTDSSEGLMHNKFFVIDGEVVGTGSYNWTSAAENSNAENLLVVKNASLASSYLNEFNYLWGS